MTGYRKLPTSDPVEQELRDAWHKAKEAAETPSPSNMMKLQQADRALCEFLWKRANTIVAKDRAKHPKAKRNLPVGAMGKGGDRILP